MSFVDIIISFCAILRNIEEKKKKQNLAIKLEIAQWFFFLHNDFFSLPKIEQNRYNSMCQSKMILV